MNEHLETEATRVNGCWHRRDFGHLDLQLIVNDLTAYTKPWGATVTVLLLYIPDEESIEPSKTKRTFRTWLASSNVRGTPGCYIEQFAMQYHF